MWRKFAKLILILLVVLFPLTDILAANTIPTKERVGLNVHWTLGGFNKDELYGQRLSESRTKWAREHFYTEVFYSDNTSWGDRYEDILKEYKARDIKVVGMLAYGPEEGNYASPDLERWEMFIDYMVRRYKRYVSVWEIWNEPDSPDYLQPNTVANYLPILDTAYDKIKSIDSHATVLAAGLASPNATFAEGIYSGTDKFDALSFHAYYCGWALDDGSHDRLINDLNSLKAVVDKYKGNRTWVTETGCSTGARGVTESYQAQYLEEAIPIMLDTGFIERILVYNIRNYDYEDQYEANFGLVDEDLNPRPAWNWYKNMPIGPYNVERGTIAFEQEKAVELKSGLERYFGAGLIPISAENWTTVANAYTYGGYSVKAITQAIRYGGKTTHPSIPFRVWSKTDEYRDYINKDWTGGMIIHAYGQPRALITTEQGKANELQAALRSGYDYANLGITQQNWGGLLNAYVYGGYSVADIAKAYKCNGAVHFEIDKDVWQLRPEYQAC
ncbi:MAG: glycosyl hydrolase [Parcubacteria group bacterium]